MILLLLLMVLVGAGIAAIVFERKLGNPLMETMI
jgi:hypothetical protein